MLHPGSFRWGVAALLLGSAACASFSQSQPAYLDHVQAPGNLSLQLDHILSGFEKKGFAGTVLVARGGQVLLYKGYGLADREHDVPNSTATRFPLGALTNQFTAAAVLALEEAGDLRTADPAARYVPATFLPHPDVTVSDLLSRSAEHVERGTGGSEMRTAGFGETPPLALPLEEQFRNEGVSYRALERLITRVSGTSYEGYLSGRLFVPAHLNGTEWIQSGTSAPDVAKGYSFAVRGPVAASGLVAPLSDLFRWDLALRSGRILEPDAQARMLQPANSGYAYGWVIDRTPSGARIMQHVGDAPGFQTWYARFPDEDYLVLLAANSDIGWRNLVSGAITGVLTGTAEQHVTASR